MLEFKKCGRGNLCVRDEKNIDLPISEFFKDKVKTSGYRSECKACSSNPANSLQAKENRNKGIIEDFTNGCTKSDISLKYKVHTATIYKILTAYGIPRKQPRKPKPESKVIKQKTALKSPPMHINLLKPPTTSSTRIELQEWKEMPEFVQEAQKPYAKITIRVGSQEDLEELALRLEQTLTPKTKSIWFPKLIKGKDSDKRWIDEDTVS